RRMWGRRTGGQLKRAVTRAGEMLRRIAGMPDYGAYVEHLRRRHPERTPPTEREYFEQYVAARYGDGPTRCC
ncbi:MAG TPA: YbdD/YjiX family protein, partial [Gemmatimonadales bacterium]|nr:YbdD/YjiX family protein [Gemmatimonadales bacterium]